MDGEDIPSLPQNLRDWFYCCGCFKLCNWVLTNDLTCFLCVRENLFVIKAQPTIKAIGLEVDT